MKRRAVINPLNMVVALINDPVTADLTRGNIQEVVSRGASVITIVGKDFPVNHV